jgi:hypothetical protein
MIISASLPCVWKLLLLIAAPAQRTSENGILQVNPNKATQSNRLRWRRFPDLCFYIEYDDKSAHIMPNPASDCVFIIEMNIGQGLTAKTAKAQRKRRSRIEDRRRDVVVFDPQSSIFFLGDLGDLAV